jgi:diaminopimelate decarboxylase
MQMPASLPAQLKADLLAGDRLPAYVYDLGELREYAAEVRAAMGDVELYYAVKANPDPRLLAVLAPFVDGWEVASGGEINHIRALYPDMRIAMGGPGKTDAELAAAEGIYRHHVESPNELRRMLTSGRPADILLRVNLRVQITGAALVMGGEATPFGMDPDSVNECVALLEGQDRIRLHGIHAHLASGLNADAALALAGQVLDYVRGLGLSEVNLGGGMAVNYADPDERFDWKTYGAGLTELRRPGETLRVEPGRAITVYCGRYVTRVIDVKRVHGELFAIVAGGTHHIRTPATKRHNQPLIIDHPGEPTTVVGQLCTPKDLMAAHIPVALQPPAVVEFLMAGAYAWNISHFDFLMHPRPAFIYLDEPAS